MDLTRFDRYVESSLAVEEGLDPYIEKLVRHTMPETALTLLRESFEDLHLLLLDLVKLSRLPYSTFQAVGKIVFREVRRSDLVALLIDKKFKPVHDRIGNRPVSRIIRGIPDPAERRQAAKVFLELFRLLHYLEYADPARLPEEQLRDTILLFSLVVSETRLLLSYVEKRVLKGTRHRRSRSTRSTTRSSTASRSSSRRSSTRSSPTSRSPASPRASGRASRTATAS